MVGESFSASGSLSLASAVGVLRRGIIPPTINYREKDPECDLDYVPNTAREKQVKIALVIASDPYGQNSAIILGAYMEGHVMQLDFEAIKRYLPQRFPFIMLDKVIELEPGRRAVGIKNISGNDIFFLGHFPDRAVMPGAAIIESMAQTAIVLFASARTAPEEDKKPVYLFGSVNARFRIPLCRATS